MEKGEFLKAFIEDCKYYDLEKKELKEILKSVDVKNKTTLDIGAGIGRLSFPLARYAKQVIALDKDKRFKDYFKKHKKKNVKFINQNLEKYLRNKEKFDVILLAWPTINFRFIPLIKKAMNKNSKFVFLTCKSDSDFETIIDKLCKDGKNLFKEDISNKNKFIKLLPKKFKIIKKKNLKTYYLFPNKKEAFRIIKNSMKLWFNLRFNKSLEEKLNEIIEQHKNRNKFKFEEEIIFYVLE